VLLTFLHVSLALLGANDDDGGGGGCVMVVVVIGEQYTRCQSYR